MNSPKIAMLRRLTGLGFALLACSAHAVPVLQIGAPAGSGDSGTYADYIASSTDPTETDTAFTSGSTLYVGGVYGSNTLFLGGRCLTACTNAGRPQGSDWGTIDSNYSVFNGKGAILLAAVPDSSLTTAAANLTIDGNLAFHSAAALSNLFPNNHDPLKDGVADFLFFDIGSFANTGTVPDFDPETGAAAGEIKTLTLGGIGGTFDPAWVHFDALAIETNKQGQSSVRSTIVNNPGSHDVTWKRPNGGGGGGQQIPEPATLALLGIGLAGLGLRRRARPA